MRTTKCLISIVVLSVTASVLFAAEETPANSRNASAVVRITTDPDIVPLNPPTIEALLLSSAVAGKAVHNVLERDFRPEQEDLIRVEWLAQDIRSHQAQRSPASDYNAQMRRELEGIYGPEYMTMTHYEGFPGNGVAPGDAEGDDREDESSDKQHRWSSTGFNMDTQPSTGLYGEEGTTMASDMMGGSAEGFGSGGYGGMGMGGMGTGSYGGGMMGHMGSAGGSSGGFGMGGYGEDMDPYGGASPPRSAYDASRHQRKLQTATVRLVVRLKPEGDKPAATELLQALAGNLRETLADAAAQYERQLRELLDFLESQRDQLAERLSDPEFAEFTQRKVTDRIESEASALARHGAHMAREIQSIELELAGLNARAQAVQKQVAATKQETEQKLAGDTVARELQKLIEMATTHLENLRRMADSGRTSGAEVLQAEENLTRARIELARRREELSQSTGAPQIEKFNASLAEIAVDMAEREAQLEILRRQLEDIRQKMADASSYSPSEAKVRMAHEMLDVIERRMATVQMQLANLHPPTIVMIGAN